MPVLQKYLGDCHLHCTLYPGVVWAGRPAIKIHLKTSMFIDTNLDSVNSRHRSGMNS